jgi:predicted HTH transcriptional regulator
LKRLRVPESKLEEALPASILETLNERQQKILKKVAVSGGVTSGWCRKVLGVTYDTANRDLLGFSKAGLLIGRGKGRASRFLLKKDGKGDD